MQQTAARQRYADMAIRLHRLPVMLCRVDEYHFNGRCLANLTSHIRDVAAMVDGMMRQLADSQFYPSPKIMAAVTARLRLEEDIFTCLQHIASIPSISYKAEAHTLTKGREYSEHMLSNLYRTRGVCFRISEYVQNGTYQWLPDTDCPAFSKLLHDLENNLSYFHHMAARPEMLRDHDNLLRKGATANVVQTSIIHEWACSLTVNGMPDLANEPLANDIPASRTRLLELAQHYCRVSVCAEYHREFIAACFRGKMHGQCPDAAYGVTAQAEAYIKLLADAAYRPTEDALNAACLRARQLDAKYSVLAAYAQFNPRRIYQYRDKPEEWSSYCIEFARCLRGMETTMAALEKQIKTGLKTGLCAMDEWLHQVCRDVALQDELAIYLLTDELEQLRQLMLQDLAKADVPPYDDLKLWARNMENMVQGLAFIYIDRFVVSDAPPVQPVAVAPEPVTAWPVVEPSWAGAVLH